MGEFSGRVAVVTLNRPKQYNAMSSDVLRELNRALASAPCDCGRTLDDRTAHAADHAAGQITVGGRAEKKG